MLTEGPVPNPKRKSIISSFLTLPHLLGRLICTRNNMFIVLLLQKVGGWDRWGVVDLYTSWVEGTGGGYHVIVFVFFYLVYFFFVLSCPQSL